MKPTLVILAAGIGSRYGSLKQIDPVGPSGEAIMDYSIYDAIRAGFGRVVFVIRRNLEQEFREIFGRKLKKRVPFDFAFQELYDLPPGITIPAGRIKPWGTGHAVLAAKDKIREPFVVINADDFYGHSAYRILGHELTAGTTSRFGSNCMVGYRLGQTLSDYGTVSRGICNIDDRSYLAGIVEKTKIERTGSGIIGYEEDGTTTSYSGEEAVSMNIWGFTPDILGHIEKMFGEFIRAYASSPKAEFYIPSVVNELVRNSRARMKVFDTPDRWFGITYKEDKATAVNNVRRLIDKGIYPENLWE
jgi:NDP-sugar pyrophosphorylase family protein